MVAVAIVTKTGGNTRVSGSDVPYPIHIWPGKVSKPSVCTLAKVFGEVGEPQSKSEGLEERNSPKL